MDTHTIADLEAWIVEAAIPEMQQAMERGTISSEKLVQAYLDRIDRFNGSINAVLEVNPDVLEIARALDEERRLQGSRGTLHGIPILLKDNIDTGDRMHTSAGSIALADHYASEDAGVAARLRAAGAVLLGKTNMTEWANFISDHMPCGYSSRGGQVLNPYGAELYIGGSSSGSGAAAAAGFAAACVGTETSGSIINPASNNAIVGIKPTIGLVSRTGIIPIAHSQDTAGPMARTVMDAAILLGAMAGEDPRDPATSALPAWAAETGLLGFVPAPDNRTLQGVRIGVLRGRFGETDAEGVAAIERALEDLRRVGAEIVDPIAMGFDDAEIDDYNVLIYEIKRDLNDYLASAEPSIPVHSMSELIAFNEAHAESALRYGQAMFLAAEKTSGTLTEPEYLESRQRDLELTRTRGIDWAMDEHRLDAILFPSYWACDIACKAGYPIVTVPAGFTAKGPIGLSLTGRAFSERELIRIAYVYEQATRHRVPPELHD